MNSNVCDFSIYKTTADSQQIFLTLALGTTGFIIGLAMYWIYTLLNGNVQGNTARNISGEFCIACLILFSSTAIVIPFLTR